MEASVSALASVADWAGDVPASTAPAIRVSRSAIADRQLCEQRRWWGYHAGGTGYAPVVTPPALVIGDLLHQWMAVAFGIAYRLGDAEVASATIPGLLLAQMLETGGDTDEDLLAFALAYAWCTVRLPLILDEHEVVSAEEEWAFRIADDIEIPQRMDVVLRRKGDGIISTLDFKTLGAWSPDWQDKFFIDLQPMLYTEALERTLGDTGGIQFEGMVKGRKDTWKTGPYAGESGYGSILVSPYVDTKDGDKLTPHYRAGLGRMKLITPEQVAAWIDLLVETELEILNKQFPSFPMFLPSQANRDAAIVPALEGERRFAARLPGAGQHTFERNTGSCLKYGSDHRCPFFELCWHGGGEAPLETGMYIPREDHHAE